MSTPPRRRIEVEDVGDVSVVRFADRRALDDRDLQRIGDDLFRLAVELGRHRLLLDLGVVERWSNALLVYLIRLQRKPQPVQGRLVQCHVPEDVWELFQRFKLDRHFAIVRHPDLTTPEAVMLEVFGNPERPVTFSPEWKTDTVLALAKQIRESGEFSVMPILADAMQDAGCENPDILNHLRSTDQPHVRECWALDLILGKV